MRPLTSLERHLQKEISLLSGLWDRHRELLGDRWPEWNAELLTDIGHALRGHDATEKRKAIDHWKMKWIAWIVRGGK